MSNKESIERLHYLGFFFFLPVVQICNVGWTPTIYLANTVVKKKGLELYVDDNDDVMM
jgi:hypothetical protein